jgi:hypothetical protein
VSFEDNFTFYTTVLEFNDRVIGGIPIVSEEKKAKVYANWLKGQHVEDTGEDGRSLLETLEADQGMPVLTVEADDQPTTGFKKDAKGLYLEARLIKANIRESAQRLGLIKDKRGARQVLQHDLHVRAPGTITGPDAQHIYLYDQDSHNVIRVPTDLESRPIAVMTPQGPRNAIKRYEVVEGAYLQFDILVLANGLGKGIMTEENLRLILDNGGFHGLGADRSQGEGTYVVKEFTQV